MTRMLALRLQPVTPIPGDVAAKASTTIIESGVLGALLIIAVIGITILIWLLVRVQNARVVDIQKQAEVSNRMVETLTRVNETLEEIVEGNKEEAKALQALHSTMQTLLLLSKVAPSNMSPPAIPTQGK